jgi:hypothetical protein
MTAVEKGSGLMGDEKLAAVGIWPGVGHGEYASLTVPEVGMKFVFKPITGSAGAIAHRVTALDHEARDDAVKYGPVV